MSVITQTELENASLDLASIGGVVNGTATPGIVVTRLGTTVKTLAKVVSDIEATTADALDIIEANIASINILASAICDDLTDLAAIDYNTVTSVLVKGVQSRNGIFHYDSSDLSANVTIDTQNGIYVAPASDTTGESGAWVRQHTGKASPLWFGVTLDGTASDTAFAAFINAIVAFNIAGELPSGTITLANKLTKNIGGSALTLLGAGSDLSILLFTGSDCGFNITRTYITGHEQTQTCITFKDIGIHTSYAGSGTAITITYSPTLAAATTHGFLISDCKIQGSDVANDYWNRGIYVVDGWCGTVNRVIIKGKDDISYPFYMSTGVDFLRCNDCVVRECNMYHLDLGIYMATDTGSYGDGTAIYGNVLVGVGYGVYIAGPTVSSQRGIYDNHVNAYVGGLFLTNVITIPIYGNLIFKTHVSTQNNWNGILCTGGYGHSISNNTVSTPGAPSGVTNYLIAVSTTDRTSIAGNKLLNGTGTVNGISVSGEGNRIYSNIFDTTITTPTTNNSGTNQYYDNG